MKYTISLTDKKVYDFEVSAKKAVDGRENMILGYRQPDYGLLEQDRRVLAQMTEQTGPKAEVGALILAKSKKSGGPKCLADKFYKNHRSISADDMATTLKEVEDIAGPVLLVSPNWLGDGRVGLGKYGSTSCATDGATKGSIKTIFKLTGLTSRLNAHHWVQGMKSPEGQDVFPVLVVIDEKHQYVTPTGEILAGPAITNQKVAIKVKPAEGIPAEEVVRSFNAGRIVDHTGLKGVTVPVKELGNIEYDGKSIPVDLVAGPNSIKGGLSSAKIWAHQFLTGTQFKLVDNIPSEVLTGTWKLPNGRFAKVKFGISYVILTELADQFDKFNVHQMGTEVVRTLELQGNGEVVNSLLTKTDTTLDKVFRQMLAELPNDAPAWTKPAYDSSQPWNLTSKVVNWERTPFPDSFRNLNGRLVPSKEFVKAHSILTEEGVGEESVGAVWLTPAWATAWAGYLVSEMSGHNGNDERLNNALFSAIEGKRGSTRIAIRPRIPCLQGKQVGCYEIKSGIVGTTKQILWGRGGMTVRYPVLWNQIQKSVISKAPRAIGQFQIDLEKAKGLVFRNVQDMYWEQSDSDGDTCFTYVLSDKAWGTLVEYKGSVAGQAFEKYRVDEEAGELKDRPVTEYTYEQLREELLKASMNKVSLGTATIDLWRIADGMFNVISNAELIDVIDVFAYYIQDVVVRGIKHEGSRTGGYDALKYLAEHPVTGKYATVFVDLFSAELDVVLTGMGQMYETIECMLQASATWIGSWIKRVYQANAHDLMLQEILEYVQGDQFRTDLAEIANGIADE